jgi:XTP/dITP diphosphohydrolase
VRYAQDPAPVIAVASWEGCIAREPRGSGGFGYDPLFVVGNGPKTAAELPESVKNRESHRAVALRRLRAALESV